MKRIERISITRIIVDLIKADAIIDAGEMEMYARLREKYRITREIERAANAQTLAEAVRVMSMADVKDRYEFLQECSEMTVSDGFCDPTEAIIMIALQHCIHPDFEDGEVISAYDPNLKIGKNQLLYVEGEYHKAINEEISHQYRNILNELKTAGINFVYIPKVAEHYREYNSTTFKDVASFLAPNLSDEELDELITHLSEMTTVQFSKEQLQARLNMDSIINVGPSILIKLGNDYVGEKLYGNFFRLDVDDSICATIQDLMDMYKGMLSSDVQVISNVEESEGQFLYHGFYQQIFDMYTIREGVRCTMEFNPYNGEIVLPEISRKVDELRRKEKAFYLLLMVESLHGGVSFNQPTNAKQYAAYSARMEKLKAHYNTIYECFGGEKDSAPDIEKAEIRRPMIAAIRQKIKKLQDEVSNIEDFIIQKDENGLFLIPIDNTKVKVLTTNGFVSIAEWEDDGNIATKM